MVELGHKPRWSDSQAPLHTVSHTNLSGVRWAFWMLDLWLCVALGPSGLWSILLEGCVYAGKGVVGG